MRRAFVLVVLLAALGIAAVAASDPMGAAVLSGLAAVLVLGALGMAAPGTAPEPPLSARSFDRRARSGGPALRQNPPGGRPLRGRRDG